MMKTSTKNNNLFAEGTNHEFLIQEQNVSAFEENYLKMKIKHEVFEIDEQANPCNEAIHFYIKSEVAENVDDVYCSVCKMTFKTSDLLEEHITMDPQCSINDNNFILKSKISIETLKPSKIALNHFDTINNALTSIQLKSEENFKYDNNTALLQNCSTTETCHFCESCSMSFSSKGELNKHKQIHLNKKHQLISHKRSHAKEKPYACDICNKRFTRSSRLKLHLRLHTGEMHYICKVCNKAFVDSSRLTVHIRTHTGEKPYVCNICNNKFSHSGTLKLHKRLHSGEKLHICEVCEKSFVRSSQLKVHKRSHTGEKPYVCKICNKAFSISGNLVKHRRTLNK